MLVRNLTTLKKYFPQTAITTIDVLSPYLTSADEKYLIPYLGRATYDRLDAYLNAEAAPAEPTLDALLPYAQRVEVYFSYSDSVSVRNLIETNNGYGIAQTTNIAPASRERTEDLKSGTAEFGWNSIDQMLAHLEEHAADFPEWDTSPVSTLARRNFVNSATEFGQYVRMPDFSRVSFSLLRSVMDDVELLRMSNLLGADVIADLKAKMFETLLSDNEKKAVADLKRALANLTLADMVPPPDAKNSAPYAIFNIQDAARTRYNLVGMEYLNRAAATMAPAPDPLNPTVAVGWKNDPPRKIFVAAG